MFEKRIKTFFNSVKICGEMPSKKAKLDKRVLAMLEITAGVACAVVGGILAMCFIEHFGRELPDT